MIGKFTIRLLIAAFIVTFWVQLMLMAWHYRLIVENIPWDRESAVQLYIYATPIFSVILMISAETLLSQRLVDITGFYRNGLLQVSLFLALVLCYMMTFFGSYILNGVVLPNLAFMACFALSIVFYLNIRGTPDYKRS